MKTFEFFVCISKQRIYKITVAENPLIALDKPFNWKETHYQT